MQLPAFAPDLEAVGRWLARRDTGSGPPHDVLVLCGSAVLETVHTAAEVWHDGSVDRLLVTGGRGHSTPLLREALARHPQWNGVDADRTEAELLADVLTGFLDVPVAAVTTETVSTHCGDNARLSLRQVDPGDRVLLVQDPTMQRRTHAGFELWSEREGPDVTVTSLAPFVPVVTSDGVGRAGAAPAWTLRRFTTLALGEVRRLRDDEHGYGPRGAGFLPHVELPEEVEAAAARVSTAVPESWRERPAT